MAHNTYCFIRLCLYLLVYVSAAIGEQLFARTIAKLIFQQQPDLAVLAPHMLVAYLGEHQPIGGGVDVAFFSKMVFCFLLHVLVMRIAFLQERIELLVVQHIAFAHLKSLKSIYDALGRVFYIICF